MAEGAIPRHPPAQFWAVDLHVHTVASKDVNGRQYGDLSPRALVDAAVAAGLHAIAVTDHNTAAGFEAVAEAAQGTELVILPGVEISTTEGHLLAIFEEGTSQSTLEDLLVEVGIKTPNRGDLGSQAKSGFLEVGRKVVESGGIAIPAHIDREKGLLKHPVRLTVKSLLSSEVFAAFEVVDLDVAAECQRRAEGDRTLAFVQSSDSTNGNSWHELAGVGNRRTWLKASRPDLRGVRHALADPLLRVRNEAPPTEGHSAVRALRVTGGFFDGQEFTFSNDLNCLVAGTGAGKSLILELIRFAVDQQASREDFGSVRGEVDSRLLAALGENSTVEIDIAVGGREFTIQRAFDPASPVPPEVVVGTMTDSVRVAFPIRAFSQGEVLEYARQPFGRMAFIDTSLDLVSHERDIAAARDALMKNAEDLIASEAAVVEAIADLATREQVDAEHDKLKKLFDDDTVQAEHVWSAEAVALAGLRSLSGPPDGLLTSTVPAAIANRAGNPATEPLLERLSRARTDFETAATSLEASYRAAFDEMAKDIGASLSEWDALKRQHDEAVAARIAASQSGGANLAALRTKLQRSVLERARLEQLGALLESDFQPKRAKALADRETLLTELVRLRQEIRAARESKAKELNLTLAGAVRLKVARQGDTRTFERALFELLDGSRMQKPNREQLLTECDPIPLVRSFVENNPDAVATAAGLPRPIVERWFEHIRERGLERAMLDLQAVEIEDTLAIEFRLPGSNSYREIEQIAHGQKCTAILLLAIASGNEPLLVDQPEDALHAPWIEEHLVSRLRDLRGQRQFVLATRSPGLVVSADAEMIITLEADNDRGRLQACGSLERHELNDLTLYHVEGGAEPFRRRAGKLSQALGDTRE